MNIEDEPLDSVERQGEKNLEELFAKTMGIYYSTYVQPRYDQVTFDGSNDEEFAGCKRLLSNEKITDSSDLTYFVYTKLYRCYIRNSMYNSAISYIKLALSIRPESVTTIIREAQVYEFIRDRDKTMQAYREALRLAEGTSSPLFEYVKDQIERVRHHGVRKAPAVTGLRYMTY